MVAALHGPSVILPAVLGPGVQLKTEAAMRKCSSVLWEAGAVLGCGFSPAC